MENSEQPAFPTEVEYNEKTRTSTISHGLTKREYFAGLAMQGILSNEHITKILEGDKYSPPSDTVKMALIFADELLKQLNK